MYIALRCEKIKHKKCAIVCFIIYDEIYFWRVCTVGKCVTLVYIHQYISSIGGV